MYYSELGQQAQAKTKYRLRRRTIIGLFAVFVLTFTGLVITFPPESHTDVASSSKPQNTTLGEQITGLLAKAPELITSVWQTELQHDDNLTSILVVGIDSRNVKLVGDEFINTKPEGQAGTRNTDTIMQIVYDHENNRVFMISIPRDMGIDVRKDCLELHDSIHWVYDKGQSKKCPGGGVQTLKDTVTDITGIKIHYHAFVTLEAFNQVVETVGDVNEKGQKGIWIDNPKAFWDIYPYNDYGWESVYFPKGKQFLTANRAIRFVRTRQYSSDFSRARRQQLFIQAVKDKILSTDTLLNPSKILGLIDTFRNNVLVSPFSLSEINAAVGLKSELELAAFYNIVIDPEFGGHETYINKQPHDRRGLYYMVPTHWKECPGDEFCQVKAFIKRILKYPDLYQEGANIFAYAQTKDANGQPNFANNTYLALKNQGLPMNLGQSKFISQIKPAEEIVIYDYTDGAKPKTLAYLKEALGVEIRDGNKEAKSQRINKEDIAIVVKAI